VRYYLIDRISTWNANQRIVGTKNVAMTEDFLQYHFPNKPTMPGILLLESMAQLAGWLEAVSSDFTSWFLLEHVASCKFYGFAVPGDQVEISLDVGSAVDSGRRCYRGTGSVEGKRRVIADFDGYVIPLADIEDPSSYRQLFQILTNTANFSLAPKVSPSDR
jgi:3-hydroxyacyl-[acyl-carrier-protein] dehydratase